jgi:hypothetical protein
MVLSEGEQLQYGWTLLSPEEPNVKLSDNFEEKVLLLVWNQIEPRRPLLTCL